MGSLLMILVNFPSGTARYWTASIYIGLIILILKKFKNPHTFKILIFVGQFVIFPLINIFRNNSFSEVLKLNITIPNPAEAFLKGDYDSYSMLLRAFIHTNVHGVTFGYQLLGNLLFFIPRSIWPSKPIGSGSMVAINFGWQFTNVSMPFIGEGYINFGIIGVILFSVLLAYFTSKFDFYYHKKIEKNI